MTADLFDRYAALDPADTPDAAPDWVSVAPVLLVAIERRMGMDTRDTTNRKETSPGVIDERKPSARPSTPERLMKGKRRWSGALVGAAAFAVVVIVGVAILLVSRGGGPVDVAETVTTVTTQPPPTTSTTAQPFDAEALAVKDAYIEASNAGDVDAVLGLFEPDSSVRVSQLISDFVGFERYLVWSIAHGTTITAENCTASELEDAVQLSCDSTRHQHLVEVVGAPAPEGRLILVVSEDGIRNFAEDNDFRDFQEVYVPFDAWLAEKHPEYLAARIPLGTWVRVAQAEEAGTLRRQYADEWAAHLEREGCTYPDLGC